MDNHKTKKNIRVIAKVCLRYSYERLTVAIALNITRSLPDISRIHTIVHVLN